MRRAVAIGVGVGWALSGCTSTPPSGTVTEILHLSAPTPGYIDLVGTGTPGTAIVTIDGEHRVEVTLEESAAGVQATFPSPVIGPQTVCLGGVCHRVAVADPEAQTLEEAEGLAHQALADVLDTTDALAYFPDWTFEISGPVTGSGGTTYPRTSTVVIHATPGRSAADYTLTVLHELGHVVDVVSMDDSSRQRYQEWRGFDAAQPWCSTDDAAPHGDRRWSLPCEDFAEVMVWLATDGDHQPRSASQAPAGAPEAVSDFLGEFPQLEWWRGIAAD